MLATTTPEHLVRPLADLLGIDDVIATRWTQADGAFTGRVDGDVVWGPGKRDAVLRWCTEHDRRSGGLLGVLRQLLRLAPPRHRRPCHRHQPRCPLGRHRRPQRLADPFARQARQRADHGWPRTPGPVPSVPAARTHSQRRRHRLGPRTHPPRGRRNHRRQPPELLRSGRDDHDGGEVGPQWPLPGQEGSLRHPRDRSAPASGRRNPGRPGHK